MPLTALANINGQEKLIDITAYNKPKSAFAAVQFFCPECKCPMHIRHTLALKPHFAHNPRSKTSVEHLACSLNNESPDHRDAKIRIRDFLKSHELYSDCKFQFEYDIAGVRRADLVAIFPDGTIESHEIQLSGISAITLAQRTSDYESRGISVFWWLGEKANKDDIKHWLYGHCGQFGSIRTATTFDSIDPKK